MISPFERALRGALWGLLILVMVWAIGAGVWSLRRPGAREEAAPRPPVYGRVPPFSLIERSARRLAAADLEGIVWIASFIYTHCTDTCPLQSAQMARLQADLAAALDFRLVSITVDPARDTPQVLARYAARFGADPVRWLFLTGDRGAIFRLAREGFRLGVEDPAGRDPSPLDRAFPPERSRAPGAPTYATSNLEPRTSNSLFEAAPAKAPEGAGKERPSPAAAPPGASAILHSSRFVLVDRQGRIRGYYEVRDEEDLRRLRRDVEILLKDPRA